MDFGRPSSDFRRSPEFSNRRDIRQDPQQQRSRSHNRVDPEFIPTDYSPYTRPIDKNARSKSLDYRDGFRDDDPYFGDRGGRGVTIPIRQERPEERRNYDYDRDYDNRRQWVETPRGREIEIPMERIRTAKSSDYLDRIDRRPQYDDRRGRTERQSPKSISSNRKPNLNLSFEAARSRRVEPSPMDYRRDASREGYRDFGEKREAARGGGHSRYESGYQYETHGGGAVGRGGVSPKRITQQPQPGHALTPPNYGAPGGPNGYGQRPVQYRKIRCCCFSFIWPPWSNEPANPPQPIYRNI